MSYGTDFDPNKLIIKPTILNNLTTNKLKLFAEDSFRHHNSLNGI